MNGVQAISSGFNGAHYWFMSTSENVTQAQADAVPPGKAHPIGELLAHTIQTEDFMINAAAEGKPSLWESAGWADKIGGELMVTQDDEKARAYKCDVIAMLEYGQAVFANTDAFIAGLSDADLDREVDLKAFGFEENMSLGDFLASLLLANTIAHTGEISALKGTQGARGYIF